MAANARLVDGTDASNPRCKTTTNKSELRIMGANHSNPKATITAAQLRAARALLDCSASELASRCGVSHSAISRAERSNGDPHMHARNLKAIRVALEENGIEFLAGNGVRLRSRE
jgi:hypothetical protein